MPPLPKTIEETASFAPRDLAPAFARMSARRLYIFGGIGSDRDRTSLWRRLCRFHPPPERGPAGSSASGCLRAVAAGNPAALNELFSHVGTSWKIVAPRLTRMST